jgi:hypothetical protein
VAEAGVVAVLAVAAVGVPAVLAVAAVGVGEAEAADEDEGTDLGVSIALFCVMRVLALALARSQVLIR